MGRRAAPLTVKQVEREKKPGRYADGDGLYLQVRTAMDGGATKSWLFRYMRLGQSREMGLGSAPKVVTLAEARSLALDARRLLQAAVDPLEHRSAQKGAEIAKAEREKTFRDCAEAYMCLKSGGWKNDKHRGQWSATLEAYAYPKIGSVPVSKIDRGLVLSVLQQPFNVGTEEAPRLEPLWDARTETASRLRGRLEKVLGWAASQGFREGDNPARWKDFLEHSFHDTGPRRARIEHHPAMPFAEVGDFMGELAKLDGITPKALRFLILTAVRTMEGFGARWSEIDMQRRVWTIPAIRMKGKKGLTKDHSVPLSAAAIDVLTEVADSVGVGEFVFRTPSDDVPISNMAGLMLLRRLDRGEVTVHGFRASFRTWAAERTNFAREIAEKALAHAVGDDTERAYDRGELLEKRRRLMEAWAQFLLKPAGSVHSISEKRERMLDRANSEVGQDPAALERFMAAHNGLTPVQYALAQNPSAGRQVEKVWPHLVRRKK